MGLAEVSSLNRHFEVMDNAQCQNFDVSTGSDNLTTTRSLGLIFEHVVTKTVSYIYDQVIVPHRV